MPGFKCGVIDAEQKMQQRIKEAAGLLRGEIRRRFDRDNDQPQDQRDPGFQCIVATGFQFVQRAPASRTKSLQEIRKREAEAELFNGIVRGFARNHDIVNVALAQSGAADANETRFLQQFWNRGATAVPHARLQSPDHLINDH